MDGRKVFNSVFKTGNGKYSVKLPSRRMKNGTYLMKISTEDHSEMHKITILSK